MILLRILFKHFLNLNEIRSFKSLKVIKLKITFLPLPLLLLKTNLLFYVKQLTQL